MHHDLDQTNQVSSEAGARASFEGRQKSRAQSRAIVLGKQSQQPQYDLRPAPISRSQRHSSIPRKEQEHLHQSIRQTQERSWRRQNWGQRQQQIPFYFEITLRTTGWRYQIVWNSSWNFCSNHVHIPKNLPIEQVLQHSSQTSSPDQNDLQRNHRQSQRIYQR